MDTDTSPIRWFRNVAPYIKSHRGRVFVIYLDDGALDDAALESLSHDLALLQSLGVKLVVVHATRRAIEAELHAAGLPTQLYRDIRVTDAAALSVAARATSEQRIRLEQLLSMGLPNSPMRGARLRVISGNFVTARPLGVVDGVDFQFSGAVRRIDAVGILETLACDAIVLLSPLGYSPTGELFNLSAEELATVAAISIGADKLLMMNVAGGLSDTEGQLIAQCTVDEASTLTVADPVLSRLRDAACRACDQGVARCHLISYRQDGALLEELFTHDGAGTLISQQQFEQARTATLDDIAGILELVHPLEAAGVLVRRSRELLEQEVDRFHVLQRDGRVIACAALYPFPEANTAEIACIAVHPDYRSGGRGDNLLTLLCAKAKSAGLKTVFVLTTQTSHWFVERGFEVVSRDWLPSERQGLYNLQRNSVVLRRTLSD